MSKKVPRCSFCDRSEDLVEKLVAGPHAFICDKCIHLCNDIITKKTQTHDIKVLKPKEIKARLDEYVIGQEDAKFVSLLLFIIIISVFFLSIKSLMWNIANLMFYSLALQVRVRH